MKIISSLWYEEGGKGHYVCRGHVFDVLVKCVGVRDANEPHCTLCRAVIHHKMNEEEDTFALWKVAASFLYTMNNAYQALESLYLKVLRA